MTLEFYRIDGLNERNVLIFNGNTTIDQYLSMLMHSNRGIEIENSFFPPKYTDSIKLETTSIDLNSGMNYMRFEYDDKYYYYFIENAVYINEDIIQIDIRLDTITTYIEEIRIIDGLIERKHINRYLSKTSNEINRDYVRENVSDGVFIYENKYYIIEPDALKWGIMKATDIIQPVPSPFASTKRGAFISAPNLKDYTLPFGISVGPLDDDDIRFKFADYTEDPTTHQPTAGYIDVVYPYYNLMWALRDNRCLDFILVPFCPVNGISYNNGVCDCTGWLSNHVFTDLLPLIAPVYDTALEVNYNYFSQKLYTEYIAVDDNTADTHTSKPLPLSKNIVRNTPYDSKYIPSLFDDNYIRLTVGSNTATTTYPLYMVNDRITTFAFTYTCSVEDGTRTYQLFESSDTDHNKYSNTVIDTDVVSVSLANDPWNNYLANIKGRMFATGVTMVGQAADMFVSMGMTSAGAKTASAKITSNPAAYDKRYKRNPKLKKKYAEKYEAIWDKYSQDMAGDVGSGATGILGTMGAELGRMGVAAYKPSESKQIGSVIAAAASWNFSLWYQWSFVQDYEFAGLYYHKYGNLVNIEYNAPSNVKWYNYFYNRYYFDYIKFVDIDVMITRLCEAEVLDDIVRRFCNGFTIWPVHDYISNIGNYANDNVEVEFL